jgi:fructokinase
LPLPALPARLGEPTAFFGGLSTDLFGDQLRAALGESGVDISFAKISDRPTTLAFVDLNNGDARYAFFDEHSAGRMLTEADLPAFPIEVTALHFGSFSLAEEPCGSAFEALMQREQRDRVISLDINVRPTLIRNRDGYLARIGRLVAMADIVKLSEDDLDWLAPKGGFEAAAAAWLGTGAKLVILTRGGNGATARSAAGPAEVAGRPVTVADTIGAGDTFTAATLVRLSQLGMLTKQASRRCRLRRSRDVLDFATRAAAITVSRPGADPPWLRELA